VSTVVRRRGAGHASTSAIDRRLAAARSRLVRVAPEDLALVQAAGALVVDIRPASDRALDGELPGAVAVERIHLEWRLDPTCPDRLPEATPGRAVVVVCNEGYASSLAAADLRSLGVVGATDLVGGFRAWRAALSRARPGRCPAG
jgi:rhodanese-related sulfurtransferase